jgi:hypothetical protein
MGYFNNLNKAADWLVSIQNDNKGWGMSPGQASSIVNTAEAIYVLTRADKYHRQIYEGLDFIENRLFPSIERSGPRTRYVLFALLGILDHKNEVNLAFIEQCLDWVIQARNKDGGWGHNANDEQSCLFPTCLSLMMLSAFNRKIDEFEIGFHWLISRKSESGWSLEDEKTVSATATALAILALRIIRDYNDDIFIKPKELLLETSHWGNERENFPGTLWEHCTYMWIFPALVSLDVNPYAPVIAQGVRFINSLSCNSGWTEPSGGETIRGQFWAVYAFDALYKAFDPGIHIYRIDSERAQSTLSEPEFVITKVHSHWAMILPREIYKGFTYFLFLISVIAFLGLHRMLNSAPRWVDFGAAVLFFVVAYFLVSRRKHLFHPKVLWIIIAIIALLSFLDLVFGISVINLFEKLHNFIESNQ